MICTYLRHGPTNHLLNDVGGIALAPFEMAATEMETRKTRVLVQRRGLCPH
jgi:hypothetical protein